MLQAIGEAVGGDGGGDVSDLCKHPENKGVKLRLNPKRET